MKETGVDGSGGDSQGLGSLAECTKVTKTTGSKSGSKVSRIFDLQQVTSSF